MSEMEPIRFVKVAEAREQLKEANSLIRRLAKLREDIDAWFRKLPSTLDGLPQTFELDDQVCYRDQTGAVVDGVVVATVTCHERYVVAPGDSRTDKREPMFMIDVSRIVRRGETPPLPGG